jgi:hypothetical protein
MNNVRAPISGREQSDWRIFCVLRRRANTSPQPAMPVETSGSNAPLGVRRLRAETDLPESRVRHSAAFIAQDATLADAEPRHAAALRGGRARRTRERVNA